MFHVEQLCGLPPSIPPKQIESTAPASLILEEQPDPIGWTTGVW
jgi:hypothetical protein